MMKLKNLFANIGFKTKITFSIIAILLTLGVVLSFVMYRIVTRALLSETKVRGISTSVNLAARVGEPMLSVDFLQLKNIIDEAVQTNRDTVYAFLLDKNGQPLVHTFTGGFPVDLLGVNAPSASEAFRVIHLAAGGESIYDYAAPIIIGKDRIGTVRIGMSLSRIHEVANRLMLTIQIALGICIVIVGLVSTGLAGTVTRRIQSLHRAAEDIIRGNLDVQTASPIKNHCRDVMQCGNRECPAYAEDRLRCWYLVGTLCPACREGKYNEKIVNCRKCPVYLQNAGDEIRHLADFFDIMAQTLKERMNTLVATELSLRHQQQVFQTILDVTPDMVSLKDRDLRYQAVNKSFCAFTGKVEDEIIGRLDSDIMPPDRAREISEEDGKVISSGVSSTTEKEIVLRDGSGTLRIHIVRTPVANPQGEVIGLLVTGRDITDIRKLHDRIAGAQKMESLGQLAAGVAHEINTPLGIILGYAQLSIEDTQPGSELHENLVTIEKYARICRTIVADLLRFSRHTESEKKRIDLNLIAVQVTGVAGHTFGLDRIALVLDLEPDLPCVYGDREKLEQVFMNLLTNAHHAIRRDGTVTLSTRHDPAENEVIVTVADNGSGIPPDIRERIFDPFFTTKKVGEGTGLGLSVTFGIIRDHGGKIEAVSPYPDRGSENDAEDRKGTAFVIRLPVCREKQTGEE